MVPVNDITSIGHIFSQSGSGYDPLAFYIDSIDDIVFNPNNDAHNDFYIRCTDCALNKANQWMHACGVLNGSDIMIYLNGLLRNYPSKLRSVLQDQNP